MNSSITILKKILEVNCGPHCSEETKKSIGSQNLIMKRMKFICWIDSLNFDVRAYSGNDVSPSNFTMKLIYVLINRKYVHNYFVLRYVGSILEWTMHIHADIDQETASKSCYNSGTVRLHFRKISVRSSTTYHVLHGLISFMLLFLKNVNRK